MNLFNFLLAAAISWPLLLGDYTTETTKMYLSALSVAALFVMGIISDRRHRSHK